MNESLRLVIESWKENDVYLGRPASRAEIEAVWRKFGFDPSADVIELYMAVDGLGGGMDQRNLAVWSLKDVVWRNEARPTERLAFADYFISMYWFFLQYEDADRTSVWVEDLDGTQRKVADSLAEFWHWHLADPERVELH